MLIFVSSADTYLTPSSVSRVLSTWTSNSVLQAASRKKGCQTGRRPLYLYPKAAPKMCRRTQQRSRFSISSPTHLPLLAHPHTHMHMNFGHPACSSPLNTIIRARQDSSATDSVQSQRMSHTHTHTRGPGIHSTHPHGWLFLSVECAHSYAGHKTCPQPRPLA